MHWPNASLAPQLAAKRSISVLLPAPASPSTNTSWRCMPRAASRLACSCARAASRPTSEVGAVLAGCALDNGGCGGIVRNRRNEPVAAPRRRLDVARLARVVAQRLAQLVHHVLQRRFVDVAVAPHRIEQRVLGYQLARAARQLAQHLEGARRHVDGLAVAAQQSLRFVDAEVPEPKSQRLYLLHGSDCASACVDDRSPVPARRRC